MKRVKFQQCLSLFEPTVSKISCFGLEIRSLGSKGLLSLKDTRHLVIEHVFTLI